MYVSYQSPAQRAAVRQIQIDRFNANALARTYAKTLKPGNADRFLATLNPGYSNPLSGLSLTMAQIKQKRVTASAMAPYRQYQRNSSRAAAAAAAYRNPMAAVALTPYQREYLKGAPARRAAALEKQRAKANSLQRQVKALIQGKKRDAADVERNSTYLTATTISCLTSTTNFATAASGTGLIDADCDEALINSVHIRGTLDNQAQLDLDRSGASSVLVRQLAVWFYKPLTVASAAGTLPPITEVLVTDALDSMFVSAASNSGRFTVLSDKVFDMGTNTFQATTAAGGQNVSGRNKQLVDYMIPVDKRMHFKTPSQSGAAGSGGHYDSDNSGQGQVDRGLLVMYTLISGSASYTANMEVLMDTRLNYTA